MAKNLDSKLCRQISSCILQLRDSLPGSDHGAIEQVFVKKDCTLLIAYAAIRNIQYKLQDKIQNIFLKIN